MNLRYVISRVGLLFVVLSGIMLAMASSFYVIEFVLGHSIDPDARTALLLTGGGGQVIGLATWVITRRGSAFLGRREALLLVAVSWIGGAALAALPFLLWAHLRYDQDVVHPFHSYVNCYFEAMSGLTTTGATILSGSGYDSIGELPRSLLLWRAITHWVGGLGIVVLFVAVLPSLGVGGKRLFQVEAPGPTPEGLQPQIRESARVLMYIYVGLTVVETLALWICTPMDGFTSVCHTFATLATGGFSTNDASVGAYAGTAAPFIIIVFMILAGANFGLYYQLIRGRVRSVLRDTELQVYLAVLAIGSVLVFISLLVMQSQSNPVDPIVMTTGEVTEGRLVALREAVFTTVSIQTTTGFCSSDYNTWHFLAKAVLIGLMFFGGCAGSTGGGIKIIRIWIALKVMIWEIERVFRPRVIRPLRVGGSTIDADMKLGTIAYVLGIIVLFTAGACAIMLIEQANPGSDCSFTSASTASLATLCTIGPGLAQVGPVENYGWFSDWSKIVLCILMAIGRLEVFAIIVLFSPQFWKGD